MGIRAFFASLFAVLVLVTVGTSLPVFATPPAGASRPKASITPQKTTAVGANTSAASKGVSLRGLDPRKHRDVDGVAVSDLPGGRVATLTVDPGLQAHLERTLADNGVPRAGVVALDPKSGRVLAYVSRNTGEWGQGDVVLDASAPSASVFKLVTAAALVDAGVKPTEEACYHDGMSKLLKSDIEDGPRDHRCSSLSDALSHSINPVFAKLALKHLDETALARYASAFGFGATIPFDLPVSRGASDVPNHVKDRLEFARTAAGFFHMHMSPMQGALIAATFANGGRTPKPFVVDHVEDGAGAVVYRAEPAVFRETVSRRTARVVGEMMEGTVKSGTARKAFMDERGWPYLPGMDVAGKTGTLSEERPYRGYTWWVGYAPADKPEIAVAVLVVNTPLWRIKASQVAREALRYYLVTRPKLRKSSKDGDTNTRVASSAR